MATKRLGRRERMKQRAKGNQAKVRQAIVSDNLSSIAGPAEHTAKGLTYGSKAQLEGNTHTRGFHVPNGLTKAKVERAKPVGGHRYVFVDANGDTWGGADTKVEANQALERFQLLAREGKTGATKCIRVVDTKVGNA